MVSLAEMKSQLGELEDQKIQIKEEIRQTNRRFKYSLWGIGAGVLLLPVFWSGIPVILIAGILAIYFSVKKASLEDKLESLESEIHKLEISMA